MATSAEERLDVLSDWVAEVVDEPNIDLKRRPGGGSHQAWDVRLDGEPLWFLRADDVTRDDATWHYTLRRESELYRAAHTIGLPCPEVLGVHPYLSAVLLERSPGDAPFAPLDREAQAEIIDDLASLLAKLHAADVSRLDLPSLLPADTIAEAVEHELDIWEARLEAAPPDPILAACFQWLRDHIPDTGDQPPSLVQGDTGPGNFLHDGRRVTAVLDFELGHLGDPMEDLAWVGTRNAQEPVPDFERFLTRYAHAAGTELDRRRIRYHTLFAELRIAVLGTERAGAPADPEADHGNRLIYGALHRRLTVEALAAAMGVPLPAVDLPEPHDTRQTSYFDAALHQLQHRIGPEIDDPWAARVLKGVARLTKYLREVDRAGGRYEQAELDDLEALLGERPASIADGSAALLQRVRARRTTAADLLPYAARQVALRTQLLAPAMGRLATSHLPPL